MIALFRFAGVDRRRPGEIAATARLSKQATNDPLRELKRLGYLERHPDPTGGRARIVQLTKRGESLDTAVWPAGREVEQSWRDCFSDKRWAAFNDVLDALITAAEWLLANQCTLSDRVLSVCASGALKTSSEKPDTNWDG